MASRIRNPNITRRITREPTLYRCIRSRFKRKQNCLIAIVGETGTGKSYLAVRIAEDMDPTFKVAERVVFEPKDLFKIVSEKLPRFSAIVIDEAQTKSYARNWYSRLNKALNFLFSTFRYQQFLVIFTVPDLEMVDKQIRKLIHYKIETKKIDFDNEKVECMVKRVRYNYSLGEIYEQFLRFKGDIIRLTRFKKPSEPLCAEYELLSRDYKDRLASKLGAENLSAEKKDASRATIKMSMDEAVTALTALVQANPKEYLSVYRGEKTIPAPKIKDLYGFSIVESRIIAMRTIKKLAEVGTAPTAL